MTMDIGANSNLDSGSDLERENSLNPEMEGAESLASDSKVETVEPSEETAEETAAEADSSEISEPETGTAAEMAHSSDAVEALEMKPSADSLTPVETQPDLRAPAAAAISSQAEDFAAPSTSYIEPTDQLSYRGVQYFQNPQRYAPEKLEVSQKGRLLQWFYDLPVSSKQTVGLISSEIISVLGLVGAGSLLIISGGRQQLQEQASAELAVVNINYNIKINQMGFGFRGQSENTAIVELAEDAADDRYIEDDQRQIVQEILQGEIDARNIEYATLIGLNGRILVNAQTERSGESFDPYGLVSKVVSERTQFKASGLVDSSELARQGVTLADGDAQALIRYVATPVFSQEDSDRLVGVLMAGDVANDKTPIVEGVVNAFESGYSAIYLRDENAGWELATSAIVADGDSEPKTGIPLASDSLLERAWANQGEVVSQRLPEPGGEGDYAMSATTIADIDGNPIGAIVRGTPETQLQALVGRSLRTQFVVALIAILADILLAQLLGRSVASPIRRLKDTTEAFASGERDAKADIFARDEVGQLSAAFNELADTILRSEESLMEQAYLQAQEAERTGQLATFVSDISRSLDPQQVMDTAIQRLRELLEVDRVAVYQFNEDWSGRIVAESVAVGWPSSLEAEIADPCFSDGYVDAYRQGRVQATNNIYEAGLKPCHIGILEPFGVKANLVAPLLMQGDNLFGLLVAHQCSGPREWSDLDISFFRQASLQLGLAIEKGMLFGEKSSAQQQAEAMAEDRRQRQEELQNELLGLLEDVEGAARGDLTVRANVSAGEIGTVADFFNAIIESLRQIVTQVKTSASQVNNSLGANEAAMRSLAEDAIRQSDRTNQTLDSVESMTLAITQVADRAQQAAIVAREASQTAESGGAAMDLTVQNILELRATVGETAKKMKRLGESSQQISKVVSLINQIAAQTNLLAINAGIEAARAGEEGQGFAAVAEEVGELAARSSAATQEIERIVDSIQQETAEVVGAIESSTTQVVEGTRRVDEAKHSLSQMLSVSQQIDELVQTISAATVSQVETAATVSTLMQEISLVSERTSISSRTVSDSLQQTVSVAQELETSMASFKVDKQSEDRGLS